VHASGIPHAVERSTAAAALVLFALRAAPPTSSEPGPQSFESVAQFSALDNGSFSETSANCIPWWRSEGAGVEVETKDGTAWLLTPPGARAWQPVAAYAPLVSGLVVRGRMSGTGAIALVSDEHRVGRVPLHSHAGKSITFEIPVADFAASAGAPLSPRFALELSGDGHATDGEPARWTALEVLVPLPCPSEKELRREILERLHEAFDPWLERTLDREGPRATALLPHVFDAVTGERLSSSPASLHPIVEWLARAVVCEGSPAWSDALARWLDDYLALCIHPATGLPRFWDCAIDQPLDDRSVEVAAHLQLLLDIAEHGPRELREKARGAAKRMGEAVLETGVLPDGGVAPIYRPSDGAVSTSAALLRRLDVPAKLARWSALTGDPRGTAAAHAALAALEYTHSWSGTWRRIDPGFDDDLGHYGARGVVMLQAAPDDALIRRFVLDAFEHFAPLWLDSSRCGGSVAADEVRDWELLAALAAIQPDLAPRLGPLAASAVRAHFKGEQYGNGAWGDVTFVDFDPQIDLVVGDLPGLPANLLKGLAVAYARYPSLRTDETRAMYAAVLRATASAYRQPFGYLSTVHPVPGHNPATGSLRLAPGLVIMLEALSDRAGR